MSIRFVRIKEACNRLGLGRSTIYRLINRGELGPLVKIITGDPKSPSALLEEHVTAYQKRCIEQAGADHGAS
jgi:predicted DNA-binding transcriptional regulator AlpA